MVILLYTNLVVDHKRICALHTVCMKIRYSEDHACGAFGRLVQQEFAPNNYRVFSAVVEYLCWGVMAWLNV